MNLNTLKIFSYSIHQNNRKKTTQKVVNSWNLKEGLNFDSTLLSWRNKVF